MKFRFPVVIKKYSIVVMKFRFPVVINNTAYCICGRGRLYG
jgi:hypothetical protein